jgi:hypothetical protein
MGGLMIRLTFAGRFIVKACFLNACFASVDGFEPCHGLAAAHMMIFSPRLARSMSSSKWIFAWVMETSTGLSIKT